MPILTYRSQQIPYTLKPSRRRRTIALQVDAYQQVTVLVPYFLPSASIDRFIEQRGDWILKKLRFFQELVKTAPPKTYVEGESFPVDGVDYPLQVRKDPSCEKPVCEFVEGKLRVTLGEEGTEDSDAVREALREWYRSQTQTRVQEAIARLAPRVGEAPRRVSFADQQRRWGSCSSVGHLRLNWRLSMMPPAVFDYVVVHELVHLKVMNHSKTFWKVVASVLPDYATHRAWLRTHSIQYSMI